MALKVVPAGDERCDIHNSRKPAAYICKDCLREYRTESGQTVTFSRGGISRLLRPVGRDLTRGARRLSRGTGLQGRRRVVIGAAIGLLVATAAAIAIVLAVGSGGGGGDTGPPTEAEVVSALNLSPNPSGTGWITLDGSCAVTSIEIGERPRVLPQPAPPAALVTNETQTVRATVEAAFSQSQSACVDRIRAALRGNF